MTSLFVTVDLGNSRCKLRSWIAAPDLSAATAEPVDGADLVREGGDLFGRVRAWLTGTARHGEVAALAWSSVAAFPDAETLGARLREVATTVLADPPSGVENRCHEPETVGRDRLLAARGAFECLGRPCLVVDAGTALTVDLVAALVEGTGRPRAVLLGGAIAPGPDLLAGALASGTARLPRVPPAPGAAALGRRTREAIAAGVTVGFRGAARELALRIASEGGLGELPVVLTGGAREHLLVPEPVFNGELCVSPDLVHRGLLAVLSETVLSRAPDA